MAHTMLINEPAKIYPYHLLQITNYRLPSDVDRCNLEVSMTHQHYNFPIKTKHRRVLFLIISCNDVNVFFSCFHRGTYLTLNSRPSFNAAGRISTDYRSGAEMNWNAVPASSKKIKQKCKHHSCGVYFLLSLSRLSVQLLHQDVGDSSFFAFFVVFLL